MANWKDFNGYFEGNEYFLIRKKDLHPVTGKKRLPIIARLIDGNLYSADYEFEMLSWANSDNNGFIYEERNPFKANLEWCPIPE